MGGANITIQARITGGIDVTVKVYLKSLSGKIQVRTPSIKWSDMLCVSFPEDPNVEFIVDSPITLRDNQTMKEMVNKLLSKIVRKAFIETWVAPHWRNFYLPLLQPPSDLIALRSTGTLEPVPSRKPIIFAGEEIQLPFKRKDTSIVGTILESNLDCLKEVFFPRDVILDDVIIPDYKSRIIHLFKEYTKESSNWKPITSKSGITVQKMKTIMKDANISEVTKCTFIVPFEPHLVFFVWQLYLFFY